MQSSHTEETERSKERKLDESPEMQLSAAEMGGVSLAWRYWQVEELYKKLPRKLEFGSWSRSVA